MECSCIQDIAKELGEDEKSFWDKFFEFEGEEMQGEPTSAQPVPPQEWPPQDQAQTQPVYYSPPQEQPQPEPVCLSPPQAAAPEPWVCLMTPPSPRPRVSRPLSLLPSPQPSLPRCPPVPLDHLRRRLQALDARMAGCEGSRCGPWQRPLPLLSTPVPVGPSPHWSTPVDMDPLDLEDFAWGDEEEEEEQEEGSERVGSKRKAPPSATTPASSKKGRSHAELKPSRVRPYAYVGMAADRGAAFDWRGAVEATWHETYPAVPLPSVLDLDSIEHVQRIVGMVAHLCPGKQVPVGGTYGFTPQGLRDVLAHPKCRLFPERDFLSLNLTLTTGKYMSVGSGLLALLARALEVDSYTVIVERENVLRWHRELTSGGTLC